MSGIHQRRRRALLHDSRATAQPYCHPRTGRPLPQLSSGRGGRAAGSADRRLVYGAQRDRTGRVGQPPTGLGSDGRGRDIVGRNRLSQLGIRCVVTTRPLTLRPARRRISQAGCWSPNRDRRKDSGRSMRLGDSAAIRYANVTRSKSRLAPCACQKQIRGFARHHVTATWSSFCHQAQPGVVGASMGVGRRTSTRTGVTRPPSRFPWRRGDKTQRCAASAISTPILGRKG